MAWNARSSVLGANVANQPMASAASHASMARRVLPAPALPIRHRTAMPGSDDSHPSNIASSSDRPTNVVARRSVRSSSLRLVGSALNLCSCRCAKGRVPIVTALLSPAIWTNTDPSPTDECCICIVLHAPDSRGSKRILCHQYLFLLHRHGAREYPITLLKQFSKLPTGVEDLIKSHAERAVPAPFLFEPVSLRRHQHWSLLSEKTLAVAIGSTTAHRGKPPDIHRPAPAPKAGTHAPMAQLIRGFRPGSITSTPRHRTRPLTSSA